VRNVAVQGTPRDRCHAAAPGITRPGVSSPFRRPRAPRSFPISATLKHPGPVVGITFDDGVRSDYEVAYPALAARGMSATFFVVTGRVGSSGYVTWSELREMRAGGMSIQSHTCTHPFLSELSEAALRRELRDSKCAIDDALGQETDQLAFPGGDPPRRTLRHLLLESGYRVVATSRWGVNHGRDPSALRRVRRCTISGRHDPALFKRTLAGDRGLALARGARETALGSVRTWLGPSRYATWRRMFIDALDRVSGGA
jgi:peptidoglycan/xylan/chitin deacetylase (PgdA/CDA1 family)